MANQGILNADMATVGGWFASGWRWWTGELAELVPARLRGSAARPGWLFDAAGLTASDGQRAVVAVDPALCLIRTLDVPAMSRADLAAMVALDADRIMPLGGGAMLLGAATRPRDPVSGRMAVPVAGLPRAEAERLAAALAGEAVAARRVLVAIDDGPDAAGPPVDLAPAMRAAGLLGAGGRLAVMFWAVLAFLFALNVGLLIWRDVERTEALAALTRLQQPSVLGVRRITGRVAREQALVEAIAARRADQNALAMLNDAARVLPPGVWLAGYEWANDAGRPSLRLRGSRPEEADVIAGLRTLPRYDDVRSGSVEASAALPGGLPFDIVATARNDDRESDRDAAIAGGAR